MNHLPQHTSDNAATRGDIALLDARFDNIVDRYDRMENRMEERSATFSPSRSAG